MPLQMIIKLDGVNGDSKSYKHKGWSNVLSWSWGMTSNRKSASCNGDDKTSFNELSIVKAIGNDSASLRLLYAQGQTIPFAEFCILPVLGKREVQKNYVNIMMEGVVIKSIVTGGGIEDDFFKEHVTLLFEKIKFEYDRGIEMDADGVPVAGKEIDFEWDVPANSQWQH